MQVVITVMSLHPDHLYDVVAINAASMSTQLSGLPFSGPIGATRVALVEGQWVGFPTHSQIEDATFDMVVAGRVVGDGADSDVAVMMVEAEATDKVVELVAGGATAPTEEVVAQGLEAAKPFIRELCRAQSELAAAAAKPVAEFPTFVDYGDDVYAAVEAAVADRAGADADHRRQAGARGRARPGQVRRQSRPSPATRSSPAARARRRRRSGR